MSKVSTIDMVCVCVCACTFSIEVKLVPVVDAERNIDYLLIFLSLRSPFTCITVYSILQQQGDTACHWDCVQRSYQWHGIPELATLAYLLFHCGWHGDLVETLVMRVGFPFLKLFALPSWNKEHLLSWLWHLMPQFLLKCVTCGGCPTGCHRAGASSPSNSFQG